MMFQNADDVNDDVAGGPSVNLTNNSANARQRFALGNSSSNSNNNNRPSSYHHHHHHQRRTKRSNNNSITTIIIERATKNKTKICLVALVVFVSFVNLMVFSRDSEARLMSSGRKYAAKTVLKKNTNREEVSHEEDYEDFGKDENGRKNEDDDSEEKPSLETALLGSALAVDSPTLTSGFKSMSYPSLA